MALKKRSKADSTEDLLDIIRENGASAVPGSRASARAFHSGAKSGKLQIKTDACERPKGGGLSLFGGGAKNVVIAVDIQSDYIGLVKLLRREGRHRVLAMERVGVPSGSQPGSPSFAGLLRANLKRFVRGSGKPEIWGLLRSVDVDVGTLLVPRGVGGGLANAVYWQMQKEKKFDPQEYIFDYRLVGQTKDGGVSKHEVMTCLVRRSEVDAYKALFRNVGFELTGLTTIPNAYLNVFLAGWCSCGDSLCATVRVDDDFSYITIFQSDRVVFSRTIKAGINSMAEEFMDVYNVPGASPPQGGDLPGPEGLEFDVLPPEGAEPAQSPRSAMTLADARKVVLAQLTGADVPVGVAGSELTKAQVMEAITPAVERIARQAERTLDYHYSRTQQRCGRLFLSGVVFVSQEIQSTISSFLGIDAALFEPAASSGMEGLTRRVDPAERLWFNDVLALSLSSTKRTMNLCHTYRDQAARQKRRLVSNLAAVAAVLLTLAAAGGYIWGREVVKERRTHLAELRKELTSKPHVDETVLANLAAKAGKSLERLRAVSRNYQGVAVLHELDLLSPESVRLMSMQMDLKPPTAKAEDAGEDAQVLVLEGVVLGQDAQLESVLTRYLLSLKGSPLFQDVQVQTSQVEEFVPEGQVLHFILHVVLS